MTESKVSSRGSTFKVKLMLFFALIICMMSLVEVLNLWPRNRRAASSLSFHQIDCPSCRWALSQQAFIDNDIDRSIALLASSSNLSAWSMPMHYQISQLSKYKKNPISKNSVQGLNTFGLSIKRKHAAHSQNPLAFMQQERILQYYQMVLEALM